MNDIEILEKKIKQWKPYKNVKWTTPIEKEIARENQAIENLINRVKELEHQNNILKEKNQDYKCNYNTMAEQKEKAMERVKELEEKYKRLSIEAQATAFDDENKDTEGLMRVLLKQGEIVLDENGYYKRQDFDWEENLLMLGLMKKREKTFYIPDDECLDEYTKQLESQLKEYNEIKEIFKKYYVFSNETIYDGCCKMQDEIDELKEKVKELEKYKEYYEDMEEVNKKFIAVDKIKEKIENYNSKGYIEASGALQELLEE